MADDETQLIVGVPKESFPGERRVAIVPATVAALKRAGIGVLVESRAGESAGFPDQQYTDKGATIVASRAEAFAADIILQVRAAGANPDCGREDLALMRSGQVVIATCDPLSEPNSIAEVAEKHVTCFSLEMVPRITRAQSMDVLSSMATVAGYRAVLLAATTLPRMFPMMMTAAGTLAPAKALIIGAGVAGLQAIATARRLGAVVSSYDVRPAVKEQVESLGAKFVELDLETEKSESSGGYAKAMDEDFYRRQQELMGRVVGESDFVITTAAIPGKKAPELITADAVRRMAPGSVIVDLAAERGGNCALTKPGETVVEHGVTILGPLNLPADIPYHASEMFAKNISTFLLLLVQDGQVAINLEDEIIKDTLLTHGGEVVNNRIRELLELEPIVDRSNESTEIAEPVSESVSED
ncbi:MAG: Re/Si-specific NAD(P)(+) transhydrogenase subunit alpha [Planctomycetota bacterium]|nr:Re/Si-specific NAD(P)(+) transhydrogenase subunit alpha [Planctomycetota bacterium]